MRNWIEMTEVTLSCWCSSGGKRCSYHKGFTDGQDELRKKYDLGWYYLKWLCFIFGVTTTLILIEIMVSI